MSLALAHCEGFGEKINMSLSTWGAIMSKVFDSFKDNEYFIMFYPQSGTDLQQQIPIRLNK